MKPLGQLWLSLLLIAAAVYGDPPVPAPASDNANPPYRFSVDVHMVVLQTTVLTAKGSFVRGLRQGNFQVFENQQKQKIQLFQHTDSPVAIGLIVDNSGSMRRKHAAVLAAAKAFAKNSNPQDELFIVSFNDQPTLGLGSARLFSSNSRELERALPATAGGGKTALYDALELGLAHVHELKQDKKALILISDGGDNASTHTVEQVLADATNSDVVIYTIGLFGKYADETDPAFMKQIALATGGESFLPARATQAANNCKRIAQTIRNEYTIGYSPLDQQNTPSFRAIQLRVNKPRSPRLIARTRIGYTPQMPGSPIQ